MDIKSEQKVTREDLKALITEHDLLLRELAIKQDMQKLHEKNLEKIDAVEDKVDHLQLIVLPLMEFSKATAANTEKLVGAFDKFAERQEQFTQKQQDTNSNIYAKLSSHDVELAKRKGKIDSLGDPVKGEIEKAKMKNSTKGIIITTIGMIIVAMVGVAPVIVPLLFK